MPSTDSPPGLAPGQSIPPSEFNSSTPSTLFCLSLSITCRECPGLPKSNISLKQKIRWWGANLLLLFYEASIGLASKFVKILLVVLGSAGTNKNVISTNIFHQNTNNKKYVVDFVTCWDGGSKRQDLPSNCQQTLSSDLRDDRLCSSKGGRGGGTVIKTTIQDQPSSNRKNPGHCNKVNYFLIPQLNNQPNYQPTVQADN